MELNPERAHDQLRRHRMAYERARGDRTEHAQALQRRFTAARSKSAICRGKSNMIPN
jgi:hypothetical protein